MRAVAVQVVVLGGLVALAPLGDVPAVASALAAGLLVAVRPLRPWLARIPWGAATVLALAAIGAGRAAGRAPVELLALLLVYLQVHRRATRTSDGDDRASALIAGLMLVASGGMSADPSLALPLAAWAVALPVALSPAEVPARTAAGLGAASIVLGAALFVVAPRWARPSDARLELTGFSQQVELGSLDALLDDPAVVFRAAPRAPLGPTVYWRGKALDDFDGRTWTSGTPSVPVSVQGPTAFAADAVVIEVEPAERGPVFTAGRVEHVSADGALRADGQGGYALEEAVPYRVVARPPFAPAGVAVAPAESDRALARALVLPQDLDPRVAPVAERIAGEGTALEQVQRLAGWLRTSFAYTRAPGDAGAEAPLADFLFDTRAGHCEYFATALAVLARARGIPARVVNGFAGGEVDPATGRYTVRRSHAHAWVEVWADGWVPVDATPGPAATGVASRPDLLSLAWLAWDGAVEYDRGDQLEAVLGAGRAVERLIRRQRPSSVPWEGIALLAAAWLVLAAAIRVLAPRVARRLLDPARPEPAGPVARLHHRARREVERAGFRIPAALPPVAAARWLQGHAPGDAADALAELAWLYYGVHLGGADASAAVPRARELFERVRRIDRRAA